MPRQGGWLDLLVEGALVAALTLGFYILVGASIVAHIRGNHQ